MDDELIQKIYDQKCSWPLATENFYHQGYSSLCSNFSVVSAIRRAIRTYGEKYNIEALNSLDYGDSNKYMNMIRLMSSHVSVTSMDGLAKNMRMSFNSIKWQETDPLHAIQEIV